MPDTSIRIERRMFMRWLAGAVCSPWLPCAACHPSEAELDARLSAGSQAVAAPPACPPFFTSAADHFRQFGARSYIEGWQMPELSEQFTLHIDGLVDRELSITLQELESDPAQRQVVKTMVCAFGLTSTATWTGLPLRILLDRAGADRARAVRARFFGRDGFENNLPLSAIYESDACFEPLIAFRLYDQRLPAELGFPFRLLLADRYGYKNIKWLQRIELTALDEPTGQYQTRGYSDAGMIEPQVMTEGLRLSETLPVGPMELCGFAVSGYAPIGSVEVSIDGGEPKPAQCVDISQLAAADPELTSVYQRQRGPGGDGVPAVWSAWRLRLEVRAGEQRFRVRAFDQSGRQADAAELRIRGQA